MISGTSTKPFNMSSTGWGDQPVHAPLRIVPSCVSFEPLLDPVERKPTMKDLWDWAALQWMQPLVVEQIHACKLAPFQGTQKGVVACYMDIIVVIVGQIHAFKPSVVEFKMKFNIVDDKYTYFNETNGY